MRPYNQGGDLPTLVALLIAVGFPILLLSLVFDFFPRDQINQFISEIRVPWATPEPSPVAAVRPQIVPSPTPVLLAASDWDIPNGHFYTQTNGRPPLTNSSGYAVTNSGGLAFWDEYRRIGGVDAMGYPLSNRFTWRGFTVQVFQKAVLQGPEKGGETSFLNVMDELSAVGKDQWLKGERFVPPPLPPEFEAERSPADIPAARLELLSADPAIEKTYRAGRDPVRLYGLPTSPVTEMNEYLVALRCQRTVLQRWKKDVPWAKAGEVTIANAGQLAIEAGLFPGEVLQPSVTTPPPPGPRLAPSPTPARG